MIRTSLLDANRRYHAALDTNRTLPSQSRAAVGNLRRAVVGAVLHIPSCHDARRWSIALRVGAVAAVLTGAALTIAAHHRLNTSSLSNAALVGLMLGATAIAVGLAHAGALCAQRARDLFATDVLARLRRGELAPRFTLYLRPFASTDAFSKTQVQLMPSGLRAGSRGVLLPPERFELEAQLARAVEPIGPLVALGAPLEHFGAGRVQVGDDEWQEAVAQLLLAAELIVLLPSSRKGTLWEISKILTADVVARTVVVDPPDGSVAWVGADDDELEDYDHAAEWTAVRRAFAKRGYALPANDPRGQLMFFGPEHQPIRTHRLDITSTGRLRRFFLSAARASTLGVFDEVTPSDRFTLDPSDEDAPSVGSARREMQRREQEESMRSLSAQFATWAGILSATIGGFFTIETYRDDVAKRVDEKVVETFARIREFNDADFRKIRDKIRAEAIARSLCDVRAQSNDLSLNEALAFVDFYDVVGLCASAELCAPELTADYFGPYADSVWLTVKPLVEHMRAKERARGSSEPRFGHGLESLATNPTPLKEDCSANFYGVLARFGR